MYEYRFLATTPDGLVIPFTSSRPNQKWAVVGLRYAIGATYGQGRELEVLKSASSRSTLSSFIEHTAKNQDTLVSRNPQYSFPDLQLAKVVYQPRQQCVFYIAKRSKDWSETADQFPYGDPECYVTVDTSQWTVRMWEQVKYSDRVERSWFYSDTLEHFIAEVHAEWQNGGLDGKARCTVCHLTQEELPSTKESTNA